VEIGRCQRPHARRIARTEPRNSIREICDWLTGLSRASAAQQFGQRNIRRNPSRLTFAEQVCRRPLPRLILEVDIGELLSVVVADDEAGVPRLARFVLGARCCWCRWAPRFIHCGYYQRGSCKIAFVWIAVQVTKHHVRFLTHRHPWRRAAGVRSFAGELATKIDGVRNPNDESDAQWITWPRRISWFAPSHKRIAINVKTVGILGARLHGGRAQQGEGEN
jgi:hypothetical protein